MTPFEASKDSKRYNLRKNQYGTDERKKEKFIQNNKNLNVKGSSSRRYKFKLGDRVKISYLKNQSTTNIQKNGLEKYLQ